MDNQANGFELGAWTFVMAVFLFGVLVGAVLL